LLNVKRAYDPPEPDDGAKEPHYNNAIALKELFDKLEG